ncbi:MAG: hypothetical protein K0S86_5374 [Geminicoccaceae bacterium]|nr:hypothetical protein [Geminicoccaceae bacterium]
MPSSRENTGSWFAGHGTHHVLLIDDEVVIRTSGDVLAPEASTFLAEVRRPVLPKPFDLCDLARVVDEARASARAAPGAA